MNRITWNHDMARVLDLYQSGDKTAAVRELLSLDCRFALADVSARIMLTWGWDESIEFCRLVAEAEAELIEVQLAGLAVLAN